MKATGTTEFDIFHLFIHDFEPGTGPFDEYAIQRTINKELSEMNSDYEVVCADSTSGRRWKYKDLADNHLPLDRMRNIEQVKETLPAELVKQLEEINQKDIEICRGY